MSFSWINGLLSALIVIVCLLKKYSIFSSIEHILFIFLLCFGHHSTVSFCFCISMKVIVSLGFFIWETNGIKNLNVLQYLIISWKQPYHTLISDDVYHYSQEVKIKNSAEVSDKIFKFEPKMFHSSCIGFTIANFDLSNMKQRLELSCHRFLSYSAVSHMRWISWVGCGMFSAFWFGDKTKDYMKGIFLSDTILQVITLLDIVNLKKFKLEDFRLEDGNGFTHFNQSYSFNIFKLIVLSTLIWLLNSKIPIQMHYYGYFMYLMMCAICRLIVTSLFSHRI